MADRDTSGRQFRHLYEVIEKAFSQSSVHGLRELTGLLKHHKPSFLHPLTDTPKSATDRNKIKSGEILLEGTRRRLSSEVIGQAISLSDELNINELESVELLMVASVERSRSGEAEIAELARIIYFEERQYFLYSLQTLLRARSDPLLPQRYKAEIIEFTNQLISEGLGGQLMSLLEAYNSKQQQWLGGNLSTALREQRLGYLNHERQLVAMCLFFIYYQTVASSKETFELLRLYRDYSSLSKQNATDPELLMAVHILLLTMIAVLDINAELIDAHTGQVTANLLPQDSTFASRFHEALTDKAWGHGAPHFNSPVMLALSLFLQNAFKLGYEENIEDLVTSLLKKAVSRGALPCLRAVVTNRIFQQDIHDCKDVFVSVLDTLLTGIIITMPESIREIKVDEEYNLRNKAAYLEFRIGTPPDPVQPAIEDLLQLIADVYKGQPEAALKYWGGRDPDHQKLHLFIRFIGDSLPKEFFVPYLNVLTTLSQGPECSSNAYHFLQLSPNQQISWDRFFNVMERYCSDFQERTVEPSPSYRGNLSSTLEMSPEDVEGLIAIIHLIQEVVRDNDRNRLAMLENSTWRPLEVLFTLLVCPVPSNLKAELMNAISAFAGDTTTATKIWLQLEASQILPTATSTGMRPTLEGGIKFELEQRESPSQEYPLTIAFLDLIYKLLLHSNTEELAVLGKGYRAGGLHPYLSFVRDDVFLRFDSRGYIHIVQQWQIAASALRIFFKILEDYQPSSAQDHAEKEGNDEPSLGLSAGFVMMQACLGGSAVLLRKILWILSHGVDALVAERFTVSHGPELEESVLLCLKILHRIMTIEEEFLIELRQSPLQTRVLATPLDQLLLRERSDIISIAKYVSYPHNSALCLYSVRIIHALSLRCDKLVSIFQEFAEGDSIRSAYAHRLKIESSEISPESGIDLDESSRESYLNNQVREAILGLLVSNLDRAGYNIGLFLLGFDGAGGAEKLELEKGSSWEMSCLNVLLQLMASPGFLSSHPALCAACFHLLYCLCANKRTSRAVMRCLRSRQQDFYYQQLKHQPTLLGQAPIQQLQQCAWLLRTVALEIHVTASLDQRADTQRLLALLFTPIPDPSEEDNELGDEFGSPEQQRMKILELLDTIGFPLKDPVKLKLSYFNDDIINASRYVSAGISLIDIKILHSLLERRRTEFDYSLSSTQHSKINAEMHSILSNAVEQNSFAQHLGAKVQFFEAWKQLVEVTVSKCYSHLRHIAGEAALYELLERLLALLNSAETRIPIADIASSVLLFLLTKLREQNLPHHLSFDDLGSGRYLPVDQLGRVMRDMVVCLLRHGTSLFMRGNMYAALLNYLHFTRPPPLSPLLAQSPSDLDEKTLWLAQELESQQQQLDRQNFNILESAGDRLIDVICTDATYGSELWKSLAFALLDALVGDDRQSQRQGFVNQRGFLNHFLSLFDREDSLMLILMRPGSDALNQLYVYESQLSMITRMAQTTLGAKMLLENKIFLRLTHCQFIDQRPDYSAPEEEAEGGWFPSSVERYHQLFLPILRLVVCLLLSHPRNSDVASQGLDFVVAHTEAIAAVLKERGGSAWIRERLEEVREVSGLFYLLSLSLPLMQSKLGPSWPRFHQLLVALLRTHSPSLALSTHDWDGMALHRNHHSLAPMHITPTGSSEEDRPPEDATLVRDIIRNVVAYCRTLSIGQGPASRTPTLLFAPSFRSTMTDSAMEEDEGPQRPTTPPGVPGLDVLVNLLSKCLDLYNDCSEMLKSTRLRYTNITEVPLNELSELTPRRDDLAETGPQQKQLLAQHRLAQTIVLKEREGASLLYVMENVLVVLWRHLDYYVSGAESQSGKAVWSGEADDTSMEGEWETTPLTLTRAGVLMLKQDASALQLPNLLKRLAVMSKNLPQTKTGDLFYLLSRLLQRQLKLVP